MQHTPTTQEATMARTDMNTVTLPAPQPGNAGWGVPNPLGHGHEWMSDGWDTKELAITAAQYALDMVLYQGMSMSHAVAAAAAAVTELGL